MIEESFSVGIAESKRMSVGMIVAVEIAAAESRYGSKLEKLDCRGFDVRCVHDEKYDLYIVNCGAGEIAAAAATQMLISAFNVDMIMNFGVVGGLTPEMKVAKLCVVEKVVHYDFDTSEFSPFVKAKYEDYSSPYIPTNERLLAAALTAEPELKRVICASGDKFIASADNKRSLHEEYSADICEMEAAGIVLTCNRSGVPCLLIKAVSDAIDGGAEEFSREVDRCALVCLETMDRVVSLLFSEHEF